MIAALYVATGGCYFGLPDVDPWDESRDARTYDGPHPVVAHPPCARWGAYWWGGPGTTKRYALGDDGGCFAAALASVRRWGGVLEHPAKSHAWRRFALVSPPMGGGWVRADLVGYTCCVEQGHYGHRARKATWLYAVGTDRRPLIWGPSDAEIGAGEEHATEEARKRAARTGAVQRMGQKERLATPPAFRDALIGLARSAQRVTP